LFDKMTVLEHPRYIQQYKSKEKQLYIDKYMLALKKKIPQSFQIKGIPIHVLESYRDCDL
jgi:hypothetical protein